MAKDFDITSKGLLVKYTGNRKDVVIPDSVTSIGDRAFQWHKSLTSVTIPDSVTSIGDSAFSSCRSLTSVVIPASVTNIGNSAFAWCESLTSVVIPDSVTNIGDRAFFRCSSLTSVTIPDSVVSIGSWAFSGCRSLTCVTIPDSVIRFGAGVFSDCISLKNFNVNEKYKAEDGMLFFEQNEKIHLIMCYDRKQDNLIPEGINIIESGAFSHSSLEKIVIPSSVTSIGAYAFYECRSLTSLVIPASVTSMGDSVFRECRSLTSITIPASVTSIGNSAFYECSSLENVVIPASVTSIGDSAFRKCRSLTSVVIPDGVTSIGAYAFYECRSLTSVTIPASVTNIEDSAFCWHRSLTSVTIPASVTSIGDSAFYECSSLTSVVIPASVTSMGDSAFRECRSLTRVVIPDGVTSIGDYAFNGCSSLKKVVIPASLVRIGNSVFSACSALTNVSVLPGIDNSIGCKSLTKDTFGNDKELNSIYAPSIPLSHLKSEGFAMIAAKAFISKRARYKDLSIRDEYIKYISSQRKKLLPDIYKRDDVKLIMLLADAKKITKKNIEEDYLLPAIQCKAKKCAAYLGSLLEELTDGKTSKNAVNISGRELWDGTHFSIDGKKLLKYEDKEGQKEYYVPEGTREIDPHAFHRTNLEKIYLPESVKIIRNNAFSAKGGRNLYVFFPRSLSTISSSAIEWRGGECYALVPNAEIVDIFCAKDHYRRVNCIYTGGPIDDLGIRSKWQACKGFLYADHHMPDTVNQWRSSYLKYIKQHEKTYIKQIPENEYLLKLMLDEELLSKSGTKIVLEKAIKKKQTELAAALLNYQRTMFATKQKKDKLFLSDDDPDMRRRMKMAARREQIKNQKGIKDIVFVASGDFEYFGWTDLYYDAKDMSDLKEYIESRGGYLRAAVSSKTDYLICNDPDSDTVKCRKAKELQVPFITEKEFLKMANEIEE